MRLNPRSAYRVGVLLAIAALSAGCAAAAAQSPAADTQAVHLEWTSPLLPDRHWAVDALWKAESLGLLEGFLPAQRSVPRYTAGVALLRAREKAEREASRLVPLADGWYARFVEEFPDFEVRLRDEPRDGGVAILGSAVSVGYERWSGRVAPGVFQFPPDRTGALALAETDHPVASASVALASGRHFSGEFGPSVRQGELGLDVAEVAGGWRHWSLSLGRRSVAYSADGGEGVVLSGGVPLDRIQLETRVPLRLGGWLHHLGPISFNFFFGVLPEERHPGRPYFWGARGALQPHPRMTFSVQRAAMFGGDGSEMPVTLRRLAQMLVGSVAGGPFEDQIVSVSGRYRLPSESLLPLTAYLEWGAEDGAGALRDVPGRVAGILTPALPGFPQASLGVEVARFGAACCSNPPWYRHYGFPGNWAGAERPLGHRLGGQGDEVRIRSRAELLRSRLRLEADAFRRTRAGDNLFVPGRDGESHGLIAGSSWRISPTADLSLMLAEERGDGWAERRLQVGGTLFIDMRR